MECPVSGNVAEKREKTKIPGIRKVMKSFWFRMGKYAEEKSEKLNDKVKFKILWSEGKIFSGLKLF